MKKFTRISTLALVLVLVCLCATAVFAATISGTTMYAGAAEIESHLQLEDTFAKGSIVVEANTGNVSNCHSIISMTYVTWPEDMMRPSAYETDTYSRDGYATTGNSLVMNASSGYVSVEATADYYVYAIVNGVAYTRYPANLYLER